jgi:RNA polymerase sigma-70 factor (ECF subfamily)
VYSSSTDAGFSAVPASVVTEAGRARVHVVGMTDEELVRLTLGGDARAFTTLIDRHAPACLRYATRMLGERADAEDVAQETFLRVHKSLSQYDGRTPFRSWLLAILVNRCRTSLSQRIRRERRLVSDDTEMLLASVPSTACATDLREDVERALRRLVAEQREAFLLRHVEQLEYDEIARLTDARPSAVRMRVKRACDRLQELLRDGDGEGEAA